MSGLSMLNESLGAGRQLLVDRHDARQGVAADIGQRQAGSGCFLRCRPCHVVNQQLSPCHKIGVGLVMHGGRHD